MILEVTAENIAKGIPTLGNSCAIALALRQTGKQDVYCCPAYIEWSEGSKGYIIKPSPPDVQQFMRDFDAQRHVEPSTFELQPICTGELRRFNEIVES